MASPSQSSCNLKSEERDNIYHILESGFKPLNLRLRVHIYTSKSSFNALQEDKSAYYDS